MGRSRYLGLEPDGFLVVVDGLVQPTLSVQGIPRLLWGMSRPIIWVEPDGFAVVADGLVPPAQIAQGQADGVAGPGWPRAGTPGPHEETERTRRSAGPRTMPSPAQS